jgi:RNA polymerase sigma factor (sigma-70 family)
VNDPKIWYRGQGLGFGAVWTALGAVWPAPSVLCESSRNCWWEIAAGGQIYCVVGAAEAIHVIAAPELARNAIVNLQSLDDETDGGLIRRFAQQRDEWAFATLVARRSALVAGVCARMLHNRADAEDAFQAVFLVLARRSHGLQSRTSLAGWLHDVAVRVCLNERRGRRRRERQLQEAGKMAQESAQPERLDGLKLVVDEALAALPERLREVLVLCDLEGHTQAEAARALAIPVRTLEGRLARGREAMRKRLVRGGLPIAAGGVAAALSSLGHAAPVVSIELVRATAQSAHIFVFGTAAAKASLGAKITSLAEGVLYAMVVNRWKIAVCLVVLMALMLVGGTTLVPGLANIAFAGQFFHDDFEDGSATDGMPVNWALDLHLNGGTHAVQNGSYVVTPDAISDYANVTISEIDLIPQAGTFSEVSLRSVVRLLGPHNGFWIGLAGRVTFDETGKANTGLWGAVRPAGQLTIGAYNVKENLDQRWQGNYLFTGSVETRDVNVQLDFFADSAAFTAWEVGSPRPARPQLVIPDLPDYLPSEGGIGLWTAQDTTRPVVPVAFRYFEAAPIPEPTVASLTATGGGALALAYLFGRLRFSAKFRRI